jgi:Domain of unknown function (DUF4258)
MKKTAPFLLLIVMAVAIIVIKQCKNNNTARFKTKTTTNTQRKDPADQVSRDKGFNRRVSYLEYSNHARCRMDCRHITQAEVEDIMQNGRINYNKSDLQNTRCPRYAVEGITRDDQRVRIVFAQCNEKSEVVTVIDLDTEWACHCPGDDQFKNKN